MRAPGNAVLAMGTMGQFSEGQKKGALKMQPPRLGTSGVPGQGGLNIQELYNHYQSSSGKNPTHLSNKQSELIG